MTAHHDGTAPATFVGLGERGKASEAVADEAVDQLVAFEAVPRAAIDPHSADQILLPLALARGRSEFTVSEVTEHLAPTPIQFLPFSTARSRSKSPEKKANPGVSLSNEQS